jgi:hypothetical protein
MSVYELSTECTCTDEDGNETSECWGYCYGDALDEVKFALDQIIEAHDIGAFIVTGSSLGWQRQNARGVVEADSMKVIEGMQLNSQYRLEFALDESSDGFSVVRYSHDEPTGASFTFEAANVCDSCHEVPCTCSICELCGEAEDGDNPLCKC